MWEGWSKAGEVSHSPLPSVSADRSGGIGPHVAATPSPARGPEAARGNMRQARLGSSGNLGVFGVSPSNQVSFREDQAFHGIEKRSLCNHLFK